MPAEIPGYYFDATSNRYFKIQPNHIAPVGANYSRQAVNAQKVLEETQRQEEASKQSEKATTVSRSRILQNPLFSFDRRLGNVRARPSSFVSDYYAASLRGANAVGEFPILEVIPGSDLTGKVGYKFAIAPDCGALLAPFAYTPDERPDDAPNYMLFALARHGRPLQGHGSNSDSEHWPVCTQQDSCGHLYQFRQCSVVWPAHNVDCIVPAGPGFVLWTHHDPGSERSYLTKGAFTLDEAQNYSTPEALRPVNPDLAFAAVTYQLPCRILDLATPPSGTMVALATSCGVAIIPDFCNGREGDMHKTHIQGEQMVVEFKDERVVMSGTRSGRLNLCDTRSLDASSSVACRIQHSSAISGLAMLPDRNRVLVNDLSDMKIYDLRFAQAPSPLSRGSSRKANKSRAANYEHTKPALTFNVPQSRRQNQYGLGFAYDPELNTVVRASTDFVSNHRVGIWSANSGQLLSSPLNEHKFAAPVTCAEIVRVRDGPKSILLATDGEIQEWCAQGRGF
ncbi:hypothetical protein LTR99_008392 [Exophiala xenobiotica]|uniref:Myocyte-specific enhancer factor 2d n=1 Tax=Vermiconidia calcicola TaxID=1690605 RepID=A0AAV9Q093_9PEZI|nr:hypothetical protein LTR72_008489 [Exophiala xenobiotica]KAK5296751.1 hypothetical protein LTR99_008392 [Exophiala xenobiotica]KAK5479982.1 hypothetical protein LTR55_007345 [Exophiala xenobiotica]KAK5531164.1 hypothetical protein LTR23_010078 [Chaetothyriales sp. CCFEE 6169]KAK5532782.1 hypothetical protein LTR25_007486 [Vermiconidia calcicola]